MAQRRHRITRLLAQLMRLRPRAKHELHLFASDAVLTFVTTKSWLQGSSTRAGISIAPTVPTAIR